MTAPLIATPLRYEDLARSTPATSYVLRVDIGGTVEDLPFPVTGTLTAGRNYWTVGDGQADASTLGGVGDLWDMLCDTIHEHSLAPTVTAALSDSGKGTLTTDANVLIMWGHAHTTLSALPFGFEQADEGDYETDHPAPDMAYGWHLPGHAPRDDSRWRQPIAGGTSASISGSSRTSTFGTPARERALLWEGISQTRALREYQPADEPRGSFEAAWVYALALGYELRYYEDSTARTSSDYDLARVSPEQADDPLERDAAFPVEWTYSLELLEVTE